MVSVNSSSPTPTFGPVSLPVSLYLSFWGSTNPSECETQTDRKIERQTNRQKDRKTERKTNRAIDRKNKKKKNNMMV